MNDKYDGVRRLFQAATGKNAHLPSDDEYRAQIPALVDAEMAGEDIATMFPDLLAHLDTCPTCDAEYAALLELAMAEEGGELPQPNNFPPLRLPGKVAFQRLVRQIAQSVFNAPERLDELAIVVQAFFEKVRETPGRLTLQPSSMPMGLSGESPEPLPVVMATYYALDALIEKYSVAELRAISEQGALEKQLRLIARAEAKRHGLRGKTARNFVDIFFNQALANFPILLEIASHQDGP